MNNKGKLFTGIDTIIVRVSDLVTSAKWYKEKLGFTAIWEDANIRLVVLDTGGPTSLTIWQTDKSINNNSDTAAYPIFGVADAAATREILLEEGVKASDLINDGVVTYFLFYDPDGNVLEACQVHG